MSLGQSPGVYNRIHDQSGSIQSPSTNVVGVVMVAPNKAFSFTPRYISSGSTALSKIYGKSKDGFANYTATKMICDSTAAWVINVPYEESGSNKQAAVDLKNEDGSKKLLKVTFKVNGEVGNDYSIEITDSTANSFTLKVLDKTSSPVEIFETLSVDDASLKFAGFIKSSYVEVSKGDNWVTGEKLKEEVVKLVGGSSVTYQVKNEDLIKAMKIITNQELYNISYLCVPCYSHNKEILSAMNEVCPELGTIQALACPPQEVVEPEEVVKWTNGQLTGKAHYPSNSINNSQIQVYVPWGTYFDDDLGVNVWISNEPEVIASRILTNNNYYPWFAPAGTKRGKVTRFNELAYYYNEKDRDLLYGGSNIVNAISKIDNYGFLIYGQKTSLRDVTQQLTRVNVRTLQNYIQNAVDVASKPYVFEPNDQYTWDEWIGMATKFMEGIERARGVYEFKVEMAPTDEEIDRYEMPGKIIYKPTKAAEYLVINFNLKSKSSEL